jgi:hypothetical protein
VDEHGPDPQLVAPSAEPLEIRGIVLGKAPRARARGLWTKSWTASAPISAARSSDRFTPPEQWAPTITRKP